ncbi:Uncharacterised protein [Bordetella ansorpii]|jgi:hypothetical protein|uniref:Uncharacterized protein n=1 Tax=Bordetella ansorpii TaxID=288768 RepID=A0A157PP09_9BORD|nr:hypothetical protein [Bordetella ansorpii]SAI35325.1 Uncharacterised protein [Bordetella ansorpii]
MRRLRPRLAALVWRGMAAVVGAVALAQVFRAWLDPDLTLALAGGLFLCR